METIDPNITVGHNAVKVDEHAAILVLHGQREMFAIPADARRQKTACPTGRIILIEWSFNAPVMGDIEVAPRRVIESNRFRACHIPPKKTPVVVE
jgi:hypothetical protein